MADQGQQAGPVRGQNQPRGGRGGRGNAAQGRPAVAQQLLNPERAPALIAKWQKAIGTDLESIQVSYSAEGVSVELFGMEGTPYYKVTDDNRHQSISVAEYRQLKAGAVKPSAEEAIFAFKNKFEVRLNVPFPEGVPLGDGGETALRNAVQALPFAQRRVMLMSNKQFKTAYPNGVAAGANPAA